MTQPIRLLSIVGARPQFIKLAPLTRAVAQWNATHDRQIEHMTLHTGQHYDHSMSEIFFEEMEIPKPDINLGVGSGPHGAQTGTMLAGIEQVLVEHAPDLMVIFGDTNSTLAGALAAVKLHIPVAHVEAGLRSFNRRMPEEINRVAADHVSDLLLAPTPTAVANLATEGLAARTLRTGDIMYDTVLHNLTLAQAKSDLPQRLGLQPGQYAVVTVHRAENTDDTERLLALLNSFNQMAAQGTPIVFPMHPRTRHLLPKVLPDWQPHPQVQVIDPIGYLDMVRLVSEARLVMTDSGGLQKEAFFMQVPCITLRDETEWVETVEAGGNVIVGADPQRLMDAYQQWQARLADGPVDFTQEIQTYFGTGRAGEETLAAIVQWLEGRLEAPLTPEPSALNLDPSTS
jgi:UDP-N-acetylglucosamine 2-epimerase